MNTLLLFAYSVFMHWCRLVLQWRMWSYQTTLPGRHCCWINMPATSRPLRKTRMTMYVCEGSTHTHTHAWIYTHIRTHILIVINIILWEHHTLVASLKSIWESCWMLFSPSGFLSGLGDKPLKLCLLLTLHRSIVRLSFFVWVVCTGGWLLWTSWGSCQGWTSQRSWNSLRPASTLLWGDLLQLYTMTLTCSTPSRPYRCVCVCERA